MADLRGVIFVNGKEVWNGPWWKIWMRTRALIAENLEKKTEITIVLEGENG